MISTASAVPRAPALNRGASWNRAPSGRQQSLDSQPTAPSPLAISRWRRGNHANQDRATVGNVVRCRAGLGFGKRLGKASLKKRDTCPCGSEKAYKECCERYHRGEAVEPDAEALMRARYSAYIKKFVPYVVNTTHPDNPMFEGSKTPSGDFSSTLAEDVRATCRTIDFQKLEVLEKEEATPLESAIKIRVSFKVIGQKGYSQKGKEVQSFLELARFVRNDADSRWLYIGGEYL